MKKKKYDGVYKLCPSCNFEIPFDVKGDNYFRHDMDGNVVKKGLLRGESECSFSGKQIAKDMPTMVPMTVAHA